MRLTLILLLILNVLVALGGWAYARFYEPLQFAAQPLLEPAKIVVLPPNYQIGSAQAASASPKGEPSSVCLEWIDSSKAKLEKLQAEIFLIDTAASEIASFKETANYRIVMGAYGSRRATENKIEELKKIGITDYAVIQDGLMLSLGVFGLEEGAKKRLSELQKRGVKTARIEEKETLLTKYRLRIGALSQAQQTLIKKELPENLSLAALNCTPVTQ